MSIEIEVTVKSTNHGAGVTLFTRRYETGGANPRYDGDIVRRETAKLGQLVANQLDKLSDDPIRSSGCPCVCQSGGFCGGCGHAGCGGRR